MTTPVVINWGLDRRALSKDKDKGRIYDIVRIDVMSLFVLILTIEMGESDLVMVGGDLVVVS